MTSLTNTYAGNKKSENKHTLLTGYLVVDFVGKAIGPIGKTFFRVSQLAN